MFTFRYGLDDGDGSLEDDAQHFCYDDQLEHQHRQQLESLHQQIMFQRYVEKQLQQSRATSGCSQHSGCSHNYQCTHSIRNDDACGTNTEISFKGNSSQKLKPEEFQLVQIKSTSNKLSPCVYKPASVKMCPDDSATVVLTSESESNWPQILDGCRSSDTKNSCSQKPSESPRVSSVIMSDDNAVRVVLDGS